MSPEDYNKSILHIKDKLDMIADKQKEFSDDTDGQKSGNYYLISSIANLLSIFAVVIFASVDRLCTVIKESK